MLMKMSAEKYLLEEIKFASPSDLITVNADVTLKGYYMTVKRYKLSGVYKKHFYRKVKFASSSDHPALEKNLFFEHIWKNLMHIFVYPGTSPSKKLKEAKSPISSSMISRGRASDILLLKLNRPLYKT